MTNYNKSLIIITVALLLVVAVVLFAGLSFYNWTLWLVPLFFYLLTQLIVRYIMNKKDDKFLPIAVTQASLVRLVLSIAFLLLFKLFLNKAQWINLIIFSVVNYLIYTVFEVNYLLSKFK